MNSSVAQMVKLGHPDYKLALYGCQGPECRGDNILSERQMDENW